MATPNTQRLWTDDRPAREPDPEIVALAQEVEANGWPRLATEGFEIDDELSALLDKLATEGPVRGEPFV